MVSLHRLHTVAELAAEVADPRNVLSGALQRFSGLTAGLLLSESQPDQTATIASVRHAFEHGHNLAIRGGLGLANGPDGWWISYRDPCSRQRTCLPQPKTCTVPSVPPWTPRHSATFTAIIRSSNCAILKTCSGFGGPAPQSPRGRLRR